MKKDKKMDKTDTGELQDEKEAYDCGWNHAKDDESICRTNGFYYWSEQNLEKAYLDGVIHYYTEERNKIK